MPSLLSRIATEAARLVGAEGANLRILQGDRLVTTSQTQYGLVLPDVPALRLGEGIGGLAARDNRIMVIPDLQTHPDIPAFIKAQAAQVGLHSMVSIPIPSRNSVIGVLAVNSARPRVFTEDESAALAICAEQAAIAIEHARLLAAEEERTAMLERTNLILRDEITERQRVEAERERLLAEQEARSKTVATNRAQPESRWKNRFDAVGWGINECVVAMPDLSQRFWKKATPGLSITAPAPG